MAQRVIIIGGGVLGCSAAYALSQHPHLDVTLLEANTLASATTSYAAALLTRARQQPVLADLVRETFNTIQALGEKLGQPLPYRQVGSLHIGSDAASLAQLEQTAATAKQQKLKTEWLSVFDAQQKAPWLALPTDAKALYLPEDGFIDPYQLATAYGQVARLQGCRIRQNQRVKQLLQQGDRVTGVELVSGERLYADYVVDAAGPWATALAKQVGVNLAMASVRSHYWITDQRQTVPMGSPMVILPQAKAYARPEVGGLLFGLRDETPVYCSPNQLPNQLDGFSFGQDEQGWQALEAGYESLLPFFPELNDAKIEHYISGISSYTPDGLPLLGYFQADSGTPLIKGFLVMTGCSGAGIGLSGGLGRLIAELIQGKQTFTDLSALQPHRFGQIDPYDDQFQRRCALARCQKRSG
ncbi:4-methylaminobutanoate oxidase (formaldehyde-forming) [Oceanospirillum multiglobuliferum]|uniref:FAD dependent oxidoreductase domain-containing protein n=1 Tax=Oceanospirillum multiglobuliferum TaxID=64969 RepID=A0A1T4NE69_9GAMM|nr:FAD-binding oxidoreductase [Oceanospirillum multiglobuliferum]OPX55933.1 hypothetical protein BTE48_06990 [Oceanospirillum multiglobuliferum]SJZ77405.1 4-methylaminobutanoate oxidase (formaldehyde-forming) [Oceanospirillum multiglobuliferum]